MVSTKRSGQASAMILGVTATSIVRVNIWLLIDWWLINKGIPRSATWLRDPLVKTVASAIRPLCEPCKGKKASEKRLHHTYYKTQYERMADRLSSRFGKRMMRIRSATVEPVLGSLINYFGLHQINTRSREAAAKVMYMAAMAYNLKKYLRFTPVEQSGMVIALPVPDQFYYILIYFCNSHLSYRTGLENVQISNPKLVCTFPRPVLSLFLSIQREKIKHQFVN